MVGVTNHDINVVAMKFSKYSNRPVFLYRADCELGFLSRLSILQDKYPALPPAPDECPAQAANPVRGAMFIAAQRAYNKPR